MSEGKLVVVILVRWILCEFSEGKLVVVSGVRLIVGRLSLCT